MTEELNSNLFLKPTTEKIEITVGEIIFNKKGEKLNSISNTALMSRCLKCNTIITTEDSPCLYCNKETKCE